MDTQHVTLWKALSLSTIPVRLTSTAGSFPLLSGIHGRATTWPANNSGAVSNLGILQIKVL